MYTYEYPMFSLTVDAIVHDNQNMVLIRRKDNPYKGKLALPGGFVNQDETLEQAVLRELKEEINLKDGGFKISQFAVLDAVNRDSRNRVVSVVFDVDYGKNLGFNPGLPNFTAGDDAAEIVILPISGNYPLYSPSDFAFDHLVAITKKFNWFMNYGKLY